MSKPLAVAVIAAEAAFIAGWHLWRYLHHLADRPVSRSEITYEAEPVSGSNGGGYRLRFLH
jgi:hypothetical protein